jgi:endonuclease-3 related protein
MKTKIYQLYLSFVKKYGSPKEFWKKWCKGGKTSQDREEIALGAILTQRTNWRNVEKALKNLKEARVLSIEKIYQIGEKDIKLLEKLIKPSGFYKQKAKRIYQFCEFIVKNHGSLENFFKQDLGACREQLLKISGIGPETADSILLYAGDKPIFVVDEYTRRLVKKRKIANKFSYGHLQQLFQQNLPEDIKIYQDFHAMIVLEGSLGLL